MLNGDSFASIFAVTLMIMTVLMLGYHLAHFMSKHEFKSRKLRSDRSAYRNWSRSHRASACPRVALRSSRLS